MVKKQLGQFLTKNSSYILQNLEKYVKNKDVVDPFAGEGDLLDWAEEQGAFSVKGFDIDKRFIDDNKIFYNDSILNKKEYSFVITNPPYLNINKASSGTKEKYLNNSNFEDLYQISLNSIFHSEEGIVIVPINFLSADNSKRIRNIFFSKFEIIELNYFTLPVFSDTTYNVISFYYRKKNDSFKGIMNIKTHIYPEDISINIILKKQYDWSIGGEFLASIKEFGNRLNIRRLQEKDFKDLKCGDKNVRVAYNHVKNVLVAKASDELLKTINRNIILLKAIDSGSEEGKIALEDIREYGISCLISKETSRHMIHLIIQNTISIEEQKELIDLFNLEFNKAREEYSSLFLTNYRDNNRKRVSFDFVYNFINSLYFTKIRKESRSLYE